MTVQFTQSERIMVTASIVASTLFNETSVTTERIRTTSAYIPLLVIQIVVGCIAIFVNILVLTVFIYGRINNSLAYLICNLAVANVMLGVCLSVRSYIEIMDADVGITVQIICHITLMVAIMNMGTCITTIFCLCFNLYLSIGHAIKFRDGLSKRKTVIFLAFWWVFWIGYGLAIFSAASNSTASQDSFSCNFANDNYDRLYVVTFVGLSIVISLLTISFIYKTIHNIRTQMLNIGPIRNNRSRLRSADICIGIAAGKRLHYMAVTVALILGLYITCWGPFMIVHFLASVCPEQCSISDNVIIYTSTLPIVHSLANIIIYLSRSREFRNILFNQIFKRPVRQDGTSHPIPLSMVHPCPRPAITSEVHCSPYY